MERIWVDASNSDFTAPPSGLRVNFRFYICNGWYCSLTTSGMLCFLQKTHWASWILRNVAYSVPAWPSVEFIRPSELHFLSRRKWGCFKCAYDQHTSRTYVTDLWLLLLCAIDSNVASSLLGFESVSTLKTLLGLNSMEPQNPKPTPRRWLD